MRWSKRLMLSEVVFPLSCDKTQDDVQITLRCPVPRAMSRAEQRGLSSPAPARLPACPPVALSREAAAPANASV